MLSKKTQYAWMAAGGMLGLLGLALYLQVQNSGRASPKMGRAHLRLPTNGCHWIRERARRPQQRPRQSQGEAETRPKNSTRSARKSTSPRYASTSRQSFSHRRRRGRTNRCLAA